MGSALIPQPLACPAKGFPGYWFFGKAHACLATFQASRTCESMRAARVRSTFQGLVGIYPLLERDRALKAIASTDTGRANFARQVQAKFARTLVRRGAISAPGCPYVGAPRYKV